MEEGRRLSAAGASLTPSCPWRLARAADEGSRLAGVPEEGSRLAVVPDTLRTVANLGCDCWEELSLRLRLSEEGTLSRISLSLELGKLSSICLASPFRELGTLSPPSLH